MSKAQIISVEITNGEGGLLHATSPDMTELLVTGESMDELRSAVPIVIEEICRAHGRSVTVVEAENGRDRIPMPWVIMPSTERVAC